jgi:hypothetical protein
MKMMTMIMMRMMMLMMRDVGVGYHSACSTDVDNVGVVVDVVAVVAVVAVVVQRSDHSPDAVVGGESPT